MIQTPFFLNILHPLSFKIYPSDVVYFHDDNILYYELYVELRSLQSQVDDTTSNEQQHNRKQSIRKKTNNESRTTSNTHSTINSRNTRPNKKQRTTHTQRYQKYTGVDAKQVEEAKLVSQIGKQPWEAELGSLEVWKFGNWEIWKFGNLEI